MAVAPCPPGPEKPSALRLWLVRHAQPVVEPGVCYGALDVPAEQSATQAAAERLAQSLPQRALVYSSPLQRCEQLAQSLKALRPDLRLTADPRLREMDFGQWEGRAWEAIGKDAIDAWTAAFATHQPGGGESLQQMLTRVQAALTAAQALHRHQGAANIVWITHAGVARCVAWLTGQGGLTPPRSDTWPLKAPAWGEWEIRSVPCSVQG